MDPASECNRLWVKIVAVALSPIALQGCGEIGSDPGGPNKAFFVLEGADGRVRDFYLGGFGTVHECLELLNAEKTILEEKGDRFWTNREFNYGGYPTGEGWLEHKVVGAKCERSEEPSIERDTLAPR